MGDTIAHISSLLIAPSIGRRNAQSLADRRVLPGTLHQGMIYAPPPVCTLLILNYSRVLADGRKEEDSEEKSVRQQADR